MKCPRLITGDISFLAKVIDYFADCMDEKQDGKDEGENEDQHSPFTANLVDIFYRFNHRVLLSYSSTSIMRNALFDICF